VTERRLCSRTGHPLAGSARDDRRLRRAARLQNTAICSALRRTASRIARTGWAR